MTSIVPLTQIGCPHPIDCRRLAPCGRHWERGLQEREEEHHVRLVCFVEGVGHSFELAARDLQML